MSTKKGVTTLGFKEQAEIISHEAIVPYVYRDSVGIPTFGIGLTKASGIVDPTKMVWGKDYGVDYAIETFLKALPRYTDDVLKAVKVPLEPHELAALVSFHYNTGAIARAALTKYLNTGDKKKAANAFMNWVKPASLKDRRKKEKNLFLNGIYGSGKAAVYPASPTGAVQWSKGKIVNVRDILTEYDLKHGSKVGTPPTAPATPTPVVSPLLKEGDKGVTVKKLQTDLNRLILGVDLVEDGHFGPKTLAAVELFQRRHKLEVDGIIGPKTREMIQQQLTMLEEVKRQEQAAKETSKIVKSVTPPQPTAQSNRGFWGWLKGLFS